MRTTGMLKFLEFTKNKSERGGKKALFFCNCGSKVELNCRDVSAGRNVSCGCLRRKKHGLSKTLLYFTWKNIKRRCYNQNSRDYRFYGARGVFVCEEWKNNAVIFIEWANKNGYKNGLQIDRINTYLGYSPDNCRWITSKENNDNRRDTVYIEKDGEKLSATKWAERLGIKRSCIKNRIRRGRAGEALSLEKLKSKKAIKFSI